MTLITNCTLFLLPHTTTAPTIPTITTTPHHPHYSDYIVYDGLVERRVVFKDTLWPHNPCKSVLVKWSEEDVEEENEENEGDICYDNISPWDLVPAVHFHQDAIDQKLRADIENALEIWLRSNLEQVKPFLNNPADVVGDRYLQVVQLPMYISLIRDRLENGYHRSIDSLFADINMLFTNCAKFNGIDSEICMSSKVVCDNFLSLVKQANNNCFDGPVQVPQAVPISSVFYGYGGKKGGRGGAKKRKR